MLESRSNTKIIFFGTADFAVPALEALVKTGYDIMAVITAPDKPVGRKQILTPPPIKVTAQKLNLEVWQPKNLKIENLNLIENWKLKIGNCDLGVVAAYGKLIPPEIFNLPGHGTLNIHPSLLPKYRGPSPIQSAILNGEKETGVTIMQVDEEMDHGDMVASN
ncbi:MAG: methionyl-tRNA formyltransferase [Candidatus Yanofskybacteria bacterium]|nr:methionyl-tRNA formyltransferase [Candidatus Yanofskybacteria bacterium]